MRTWGDDDPQIPGAVRALHDRAVAAEQAMYLDPLSGYMVMTSAELDRRGSCCGVGCRHCPYAAAEQRRAGRPRVRPERASVS